MIADVGNDPTLHPRMEPDVGLSVLFQPTVVQTGSDCVPGIKLSCTMGDVGYVRLWHYDSVLQRLERTPGAITGVITHIDPFIWHRTLCFHGRVECYQELE
jgi:hypothetical protein